MAPYIAVILGVVAGLMAVACNVILPLRAPKEDVQKRIVAGYASLLISTVFSIAAIILWWLFFKSTFTEFGVSLCSAYIVGLMVYFVKNIKVLKGNSGKK